MEIGKGSFLEKLLDRRDDEANGFRLKTSYADEVAKQAENIFKKNYVFNQWTDKETKIAGMKETRASKRERLQEDQDKLKGWYGMEKQVMTPELTADMQALQLRGQLDPKQFMKSNKSKKLPKYFEIGTVIGGPMEGGSMKIPRKERQKSLVDEFLKIDEQKAFSRRRFGQIQEKRQYKALKKVYKLRRLKKFRQKGRTVS